VLHPFPESLSLSTRSSPTSAKVISISQEIRDSSHDQKPASAAVCPRRRRRFSAPPLSAPPISAQTGANIFRQAKKWPKFRPGNTRKKRFRNYVSRCLTPMSGQAAGRES